MEIYGEEKDRASWAMHYAQVKANITQPQRTHKVDISGKSKVGKSYQYVYKYADLADIDKAVMAGIKKVKDKSGNVVFSYFFDISTDGNIVTVQTVLVDISGFAVKTNKITFQNNQAYDAQKTASLISYAKRYSLSGAFGIAADDDDDARNQRTVQEPKLLTNQELEQYEVTYQGFKANLYDLYQEAKDGIKDAQAWLKNSHTPQDAQAIHQIAELFKQKEKNKKKEETTKQEMKKDPFEDKKVNTTEKVPDDIESLF